MQTICVKTKEINIDDPLFDRKIEIAEQSHNLR
jgi:hypothetical protein